MVFRERVIGIPGAPSPSHDLATCQVAEILPEKSVKVLGRGSQAHAWRAQVGQTRVLEAQVPPVRIFQDKLAAGRPAPGFRLVVHLTGSGQYSSSCGWAAVDGGSVVLIDTSEACEVVHPEGAHVVVWDLPRSEVAALLSRGHQNPVPLPRAAGSVVAANAVALARAAPDLAERQAVGLIDSLVNMVGLALAEDGGNAHCAERSHRALMRQRILALIEARFAESNLSPRSAASELGFSRRWLSALLKGGPGFSERVAARRIEESIRLLREPAARELSVTQIAFAAGFRDLSTFHRQFRRRVGVSPRAFR